MVSALAVDPWGWAPFGPVKWGLITVVAFLVMALLALAGPVVVDRWSALGWLGFLAWGAVASIGALDPLYTWTGTPDRHVGWIMWLLAGAMFVAGQTVGHRRQEHVVLHAAVAALIGVGVFTALEMLGVRIVDIEFAGGRAGGPWGSPAYLGAAVVLLVPIALGVATGAGHRWLRFAAGSAAVLGLAAAVGSQTRAVWVGLVVAVVVALTAVGPASVTVRKLVAVGAAALAVVVAVTPAGGRIADTFDPGGGATGRIAEWQVGVSALAAHAVVGTGFEGYRAAFPAHVDADYERSYGRQVTPDRAHNGALDVGITTGIPGLLVYVAAAVVLGQRSWRALRSGVPWLMGLGAGVVGYVAQQQFLFPIAEMDVAFWGLAGMLVAATQAGTVFEFRLGAITGFLALALAGAALAAGVLDVAADHEVRRSLEASVAGRIDSASTYADRATDLRPDSIRYWAAAATVAAGSETPDAFRRALIRIENGLVVSPNDPILLRDRAAYLLQLALRTRTPEEVAAAVSAWSARVTADPNGARGHLELGVAHVLAGNPKQAEAAWLTAADLAPGSAAPWANLATLYLEQERLPDAAAAVERAANIDAGYPGLEALRNRIEEGSVEEE